MNGFAIFVTTSTGTVPWKFGGVLAYANRKAAIREVATLRLAMMRYHKTGYRCDIKPVELREN